MIEVKLRPGVHGCVMWPLYVLTLGILPLLLRMGERHFIARMNPDGFETRGGLRVAWNEIDRVQRTVGKVRGMKMSDELLVFSPKGRASLPTWRIENADEAVEYFTRHAPPGT